MSILSDLPGEIVDSSIVGSSGRFDRIGLRSVVARVRTVQSRDLCQPLGYRCIPMNIPDESLNGTASSCCHRTVLTSTHPRRARNTLTGTGQGACDE
jgi:hypothetical protein